MDDQPTDGIRRPGDPPSTGPEGTGGPPPDDGVERSASDAREHALASEAEEIRRLIDAGAGSPEELRALAARLREHRAREESLWRESVKPALVKENKGRFRGHTSVSKESKTTSSPNLVSLGLAIVALLIVVVIAASTTVLLLVLPLIALLVWAWKHGRASMH